MIFVILVCKFIKHAIIIIKISKHAQQIPGFIHTLFVRPRFLIRV